MGVAAGATAIGSMVPVASAGILPAPKSPSGELIILGMNKKGAHFRRFGGDVVCFSDSIKEDIWEGNFNSHDDTLEVMLGFSRSGDEEYITILCRIYGKITELPILDDVKAVVRMRGEDYKTDVVRCDVFAYPESRRFFSSARLKVTDIQPIASRLAFRQRSS